ncbi:hypothetical protein GGQ74_002188 [Desulfobaculum xiamenense]|uniref:Uncharacterized protein n=1 Tax=Desulfobaculum xiamenense TaxID=995050 RepID=A0A846QST4_9BACT|nr:hypothetical protein [Desulfobaculum xiamenense]NJB68515.1 hypothetical protein [Desulfobaculum xiamenense]
MQEALAFTQQFLEAVESARIALGRSHSDIARAAFPEHRDPVGAYRKIRNSGQNLRLQDAYRLAFAVQQDFPSLCWRAMQDARSS